jgi:hypothetical protein
MSTSALLAIKPEERSRIYWTKVSAKTFPHP